MVRVTRMRQRMQVHFGLWACVAIACVGCGAAATRSVNNQDSLGPLEECAEGGPIAVDGVHNRAGTTQHPDPEAIARAAARCELASIDWEGAPMAAHFSVSIAVVEVTTERNGHSAIAASKVSATVHHAERGLVATLRGSGRAEDMDGRAARAERDAIDAATRGALRRLREAVLQTQ